MNEMQTRGCTRLPRACAAQESTYLPIAGWTCSKTHEEADASRGAVREGEACQTRATHFAKRSLATLGGGVGRALTRPADEMRSASCDSFFCCTRLVAIVFWFRESVRLIASGQPHGIARVSPPPAAPWPRESPQGLRPRSLHEARAVSAFSVLSREADTPTTFPFRIAAPCAAYRTAPGALPGLPHRPPRWRSGGAGTFGWEESTFSSLSLSATLRSASSPPRCLSPTTTSGRASSALSACFPTHHSRP